ncbi:MAG: hypothetical protein ACK5AO_04510 [bacterium]|jgi:hypothetical protein
MRFIRKITAIVFWVLFISLVLVELPLFLLGSIFVALGVEKAKYIHDLIVNFNKWYQKAFLKIEAAKKKSFKSEPRFQITTRIDPRPEELKGLANEIICSKNVFEGDSYVFYYEPFHDPLINEVLSDKYLEILNYLSDKGIKFIYPQFLKSASQEELNELLDYYFPDAKLDTEARTVLAANLHSVNFFAGLLGINNVDRPCFIRNVYDHEKKEMFYKVFYLPNTDKELLEQTISFYLSVINHAYYNPNIIRAQYSVGGRDFDELTNVKGKKALPDPDKEFENEINKLSNTLRDEINAELRTNKTKGAMRMMLFLLKQMKEYNVPADPQVKQFIENLHTDVSQKLSPIIISSSGKLILSDYNKEIKLEPIHRAVYIFFLLKQEGIMFKDLPAYKNEILHIYSKLSNRSSLNNMRKTVEDLVNPFSNSMNQKCSRIKEAFLKEMDERIARYYVIEGERKQNKRILLDRNLVTFEDNIY